MEKLELEEELKGSLLIVGGRVDDLFLRLSLPILHLPRIRRPFACF